MVVLVEHIGALELPPLHLLQIQPQIIAMLNSGFAELKFKLGRLVRFEIEKRYYANAGGSAMPGRKRENKKPQRQMFIGQR
jgi:hypothetical protein